MKLLLLEHEGFYTPQTEGFFVVKQFTYLEQPNLWTNPKYGIVLQLKYIFLRHSFGCLFWEF
jgi:hypothetical protein